MFYSITLLIFFCLFDVYETILLFHLELPFLHGIRVSCFSYVCSVGMFFSYRAPPMLAKLCFWYYTIFIYHCQVNIRIFKKLLLCKGFLPVHIAQLVYC